MTQPELLGPEAGRRRAMGSRCGCKTGREQRIQRLHMLDTLQVDVPPMSKMRVAQHHRTTQ